jgi:hypothetical protein
MGGESNISKRGSVGLPIFIYLTGFRLTTQLFIYFSIYFHVHYSRTQSIPIAFYFLAA